VNRLGWTRRVAPVAMMPAAAFAVHQLRYYLAFGSRAGIELKLQGHSYLHSVVPWMVLLVAVAVGVFLRGLGRAFAGQRSLSRFGASFLALWLICAASLAAIYIAQELLEGVFVPGHPHGLIGVFGYGGWWALPSAACVGMLLAAVFHGARWLLDEVARHRGHRLPLRRTAAPAPPRPRGVFAPRIAPLAGGWSGRGPPV
jgi:hypothetical protein